MVLQILREWLQSWRSSAGVGTLPDHVWISAEAKFEGIRRELEERSANGAAMIALVAHFPDVLAELERIAAGYHGPTSVRAVLARQFSSEDARSLPLDESELMELVVAERHPLSSVDEELVRFAEALPCHCRMVHHLSLDDALLQSFGANDVRAVLDQLGATDEAPITNRLVHRSVRRAQKRIEANATGRRDAASAAAWLERNT